jgi:aldehyde:ferredoxin oxidoreductase
MGAGPRADDASNVVVGSIIKSNEVCNRMGLDTISAGGVISWAMECFSRGILTLEDTDGIDLSWGNHVGIIAALEKPAVRGVGSTATLEADLRPRDRVGLVDP